MRSGESAFVARDDFLDPPQRHVGLGCVEIGEGRDAQGKIGIPAGQGGRVALDMQAPGGLDPKRVDTRRRKESGRGGRPLENRPAGYAGGCTQL